MGKTFAFIGAGISLLLSLGLLFCGGFMIYASFGKGGQAEWQTAGGVFLAVGLLLLIGGIVLIWLGMRGQKTEVVQQVTMKMDLPGQTSVEQMKCQSCGGVITSNDIQIMAGAPVVSCPYCQSTYQLTEEPKW
jgi:hypothetical protein